MPRKRRECHKIQYATLDLARRALRRINAQKSNSARPLIQAYRCGKHPTETYHVTGNVRRKKSK
jgi:hypothetical protein